VTDAVVSGHATFSDGSAVPLYKAAMTEGSVQTLQTNATYTVAAQDLGTYAPGKTLTSLFAYSDESAAYVYVLRQGIPIFFGSAGRSGVVSYGEKKFPKTVVLQPGDTVQMLAIVNAARNCSFIAHCSDGTQRVFISVPGGAGPATLVDSITGNGIGETLQGKTITHAMALSVDGTKIISGGVVILNAQGSVVAVCATGSPIESQVCFSPFNARIGLNFVAQIVTSS